MADPLPQDAHGDEHAADAVTSHAADAAAYGDGHAAEAGSALPQLAIDTWPGQIFWLLVSFGVLYLILSRSILPRIGGVIEDRHDKIADDLDDAARFKRQADSAAEAYDRALADARAKAHSIAADARGEMDALIARETAAADAEAAKRSDDAEARIRSSAQNAMASAQEVAGAAAAEIVAKLTGKAPAGKAVQAAISAAADRG